MVCDDLFVDLGQDIYDGEVGINEWFRCGIKDFPEWKMFYSPEIFSQAEDKNIDREMIETCDRCHPVPELHCEFLSCTADTRASRYGVVRGQRR